MFETDALYQNDPKWKYQKLGNQQSETIGSWGCLLTSLTMVANGYDFDETPETLNAKMKAAGGFQGSLIIPAALPSVCPGLIYKGYQPCEDTPAPIEQIDKALTAGKPVIVQVDRSPKAGLQTHWILLYEKTGSDYYMKDPYRYQGDSPEKKIKLLDRYTNAGKDMSKAITGVIWFEDSTRPKTKPKVDLPSDTITVYATVDGLAFRSEPSATEGLIRRIPINAMLETLENKSEAEAKIGIYGKWLHVQDSFGDQGYTAAWYVSKSLAEDISSKKNQPPAQTKDIEFYLVPIADGLAVRTDPDYNAPLVKRVPIDTEFGFFESRTEVNKKIGVFDQWIHIYDSSGIQGYSAAWYLTPKAGSPPSLPGDSTAPPETPHHPTPIEPINPIRGFAVVPTTDGLAFRSSTMISEGTLIRRLHLKTTLSVEEPEDEAKEKIGVNGKWIKVKDASGIPGYVAAWYVKPASETNQGDGVDIPAITLRTTVEGVALRRSTQISDHTLIKRLPNNSPVAALESNAKSKVGIYGEWLQVRDSSGTEGFIAAWYVSV